MATKAIRLKDPEVFAAAMGSDENGVGVDFDQAIAPSKWYNDVRGQKLHLTVTRGGVTKDLGEISSHEDIATAMKAGGLIKNVPVVKPPDTMGERSIPIRSNGVKFNAPKKQQEPDNLEQELEEVLSGNYTPSVPTSPPPPKATGVAKTREKKVPDFRAIKMEWLPETPTDPKLLAQFSSEHGDFETYYHYLFDSSAIVYLAFDKRCKFGRFIPKMGDVLFTLSISGQTFQGALWGDAKFDVGILEITPFIKVAAQTEEVMKHEVEIQQTSLVEQDNYDWS